MVNLFSAIGHVAFSRLQCVGGDKTIKQAAETERCPCRL